jgi:2-C-methyl-D-erythritol 4-phosphate cytidylyltransferase
VSVWAIVVAGGRGERFGVGDADPGPRRKQFVELAGAPVVRWSTRTAAEACDGVVLVVPGDVVADPETTPAAFGVDRIVAGGPTRADSVRAGLDAVPLVPTLPCRRCPSPTP